MRIKKQASVLARSADALSNHPNDSSAKRELESSSQALIQAGESAATYLDKILPKVSYDAQQAYRAVIRRIRYLASDKDFASAKGSNADLARACSQLDLHGARDNLKSGADVNSREAKEGQAPLHLWTYFTTVCFLFLYCFVHPNVLSSVRATGDAFSPNASFYLFFLATSGWLASAFFMELKRNRK